MEQRPLPELAEPNDEAYQFKHLDPEKDVVLLQVLALDANQVDGQWMQELDQLIDLGSTRINPYTTTINERERIINARQQYEGKLGLNNPAHRLHRAYLNATSRRPNPSNRIIPLHSLDTFRVLTSVTHDPMEVIDMVERRPTLLSNKACVLERRRVFLHRLAAVLKWQGDVDELLREEPEVWTLSDAKIAVLGKVAAKFGTDADRQRDNRSAALLARERTPVESYILAILQSGRERYRLGQRTSVRISRSAQKEYLYRSLATAVRRKRLGPHILKAYFRHSTPDADAQKLHPHLREYIPLTRRTAFEVSASNVPRVVTGDEAWLAETAIPETPQGRMAWLTKLNLRIARGSASLNGKANTPEHERILNDRVHFFRLLGWTSPNHKFGEEFAKLFVSQPSLVSPARVVEVLNVLTLHGVKSAFEPLLLSHFRVLLCAPNGIDEKLKVIADEGFDVNEVIMERATILKESVNKLYGLLRQKSQKRAQRADNGGVLVLPRTAGPDQS